jgi:hypothetical protein
MRILVCSSDSRISLGVHMGKVKALAMGSVSYAAEGEENYF